jgi:hypothetical protein
MVIARNTNLGRFCNQLNRIDFHSNVRALKRAVACSGKHASHLIALCGFSRARATGYQCAISDAPILFHSKFARTLKKGDFVHPLYAAIDRTNADAAKGGHRLVCYAIHEATAALPRELLVELQETRAWAALLRAWRAQAATGSLDRKAFDRLIPPRIS